jgi:transcriptional regulator with XRE-family HTH domain
MPSIVEATGRADHGTLSATIRGVDELADCLRTWRDRLDASALGLPVDGRRRAPGLRREELARLAGVSPDYLTRLEQGRATRPSPSVLGALARALLLTEPEREHLYRVAGQAAPGPSAVERELTPTVERMLERLADVPVIVFDATWSIVAANPLADALLGAPDGNIVWRHFTGAPSRLIRGTADDAVFEAEVVADLHDALGRYPDDEPLRRLIADLRAVSPRFRELWERRPVARRKSDRKTIAHPELGHLTVDCDVLTVSGSDLRLVVYTAAPGSPDAEALARLHDSAYARASA